MCRYADIGLPTIKPFPGVPWHAITEAEASKPKDAPARDSGNAPEGGVPPVPQHGPLGFRRDHRGPLDRKTQGRGSPESQVGSPSAPGCVMLPMALPAVPGFHLTLQVVEFPALGVYRLSTPSVFDL